MGYTIPVSFIMESYVLIDLIVSNLGKIITKQSFFWKLS